jgi:hypothetical protein
MNVVLLEANPTEYFPMYYYQLQAARRKLNKVGSCSHIFRVEKCLAGYARHEGTDAYRSSCEVPLFLSTCNPNWNAVTNCSKIQLRFNKNLSTGARSVTCVLTDRHTHFWQFLLRSRYKTEIKFSDKLQTKLAKRNKPSLVTGC